jgi:anti-sigma factor RsiW
MSNVRHLEEDLLLRYLDGELPGRNARQVRAHLEACWQCRTEVEALEATIGDCVRYRKNVLTECLPPAPAQWKPLDFEAVEAGLAAQSLAARLARWVSPRQNAPLGWALSAAAAAALVFVAAHKLNEAPRVEAAALLKKAVAASESRPHVAKRLRIRTRDREITRVVYGPATSAPADMQIAAMFQGARYDWNDPLSAKAYSAWRDSLSRKDDQLTTDKDSYSIKTTTAEGDLASATLKLRATDFEAVEGRFEFRNSEWVEMTELVYQQTLPASTVAGTAGGMPRQPGMPPDTYSAPVEPLAPSPYSEELQVYAALHRAGADVDDPVEVTREGREIVVSGTGVPSAHQEKVRQLLDRLPHVAVRFSDPSSPASQPAREPTARDAAGPENPQYPARLEARLGGRPQFERFSGQVLDWTENAMARVYALRRLAQKFPVEAENALNGEERVTLHKLGRDHIEALAQDLRKISNTVNPVLNGLGARAGTPVPSIATAWQPASEELFASGRHAETLMAAVLGVSANTSSEDANSQLLTALAQFTSGADQCLRLLSAPPAAAK